MPRINGINLAVEIRNRFPSCRVLLFSGQTATSDLLATVRGRGLDFEVLPKPPESCWRGWRLDSGIADETTAEAAVHGVWMNEVETPGSF
jgi:hypothetical protein